MAAIKGEVALSAAGRDWILHYTVNAMVALEEDAGLAFGKFVQGMQDGIDGDALRLSDLRRLVWAGLLEHQPETTKSDAGALITAIGGVVPAMEFIRRGLEAAFPAEAATDTASGDGDAGNGVPAA